MQEQGHARHTGAVWLGEGLIDLKAWWELADRGHGTASVAGAQGASCFLREVGAVGFFTEVLTLKAKRG
ncbi:hypothetical protein AA0312_0185 [Acetobacter tropicalis NRIC 0312]|uniref:Uncharacterized protein n=1 Tax=Acetobacter tropicalis TaxID=104102 RepID=A0A511FIJ4_9PROT|nr:hypothetical protein ATR1_075c0107 [Acetobacter tropicalis]GBR66932.1 hypothetical protein AA0312_0185 [Acetobacter tropicalis NRIC 0312]GEL49032.1 hypothetical protein ATR01nite_01070 [Acetobacter tropicalis]